MLAFLPSLAFVFVLFAGQGVESLDESRLEFLERFTRTLDDDPSSARELARELGRRSEADGDATGSAIALSCEIDALAVTHGASAARELLERAEELTPENHPLAGAVLELARLRVLVPSAEVIEIRRALSRLHSFVDELEPSCLTVRVGLLEFEIMERWSDGDEAFVRLDELRTLARDAGADWIAPWIDLMESDVYWYQGRSTTAAAVLERRLELPNATESRRFEGRLYYGRAWLRWEAGKTAAALIDIDRALGIVQQLGDLRQQAKVLEIKACILRDSGELEQANSCVEAALLVIKDAGYPDTEALLAGVIPDPSAAEAGERGSFEFIRKILTVALVMALIVALFVARSQLSKTAGRLREETERAAAAESVKRTLETELRQLERMQGLGIMAAGVAHDFNNLLVCVRGNAELLRESIEYNAEDATLLEGIIDSGKRAARLCQRLFAYASEEPALREPVELCSLAERMLPLLRTSVCRGVTVEFESPSEPVWASGDAMQLEQVLLNLVTNSLEAHAGLIRVRIQQETLGSSDLVRMRLGDGVAPGLFAVIEVWDDGDGMDPGVLKHIFDPFFSTRTSGRGLGLAALFGIVRSHGGVIDVESAAGLETTIRIHLPVGAAADEGVLWPKKPAAGTSESSERPGQFGGTGTEKLADNPHESRETG